MGPIRKLSIGLCFLLLVGLLVFLLATDKNSTAVATAATPTVSSPAAPAPPPESPWSVSESRDDVTGVVTKTASVGFGDQELAVRKIGKKIDVIVTTPDFLETVNNEESHLSSVEYKFDNGKVVTQSWLIASDYDSLFYPSNPSPFIEKLKRAKQFAIQYRPSDKVPQSMTFDVSQFPADF